MHSEARVLVRRRLPSAYLAMALLLVVAGAFGAVWTVVDRFLHSHEIFRVQRIEIDVPDPQLRAAVRDIVSGWEGRNYWQVRWQRAAVRRRLQALPAVERVSLVTRLPRQVVLRVTPRQPRAQLKVQEEYLLIDREGVLFDRAAQPWPQLAVVFGVEPGDTQPGERLQSLAARAVMDCLEVVERLRSQDLPIALKNLSVSPEGILQARWEDDLLVRLGAPFDLEEKLRTALQVRRLLARGRRVEYVDVSAVEVPIWKPIAEE